MTTNTNEHQAPDDDGIALARRYAREILALAARMETDMEHLHNRGALINALWALREDAIEHLAHYVGQRILDGASQPPQQPPTRRIGKE